MIGTGDPGAQIPFACLRVSEEGRVTGRNPRATAWFGEVGWWPELGWAGAPPAWREPGVARIRCLDATRDLLLQPHAGGDGCDVWLVDCSVPLRALRAPAAPWRLEVTRALVPSLAHEINNAVHLVFGLCDEVRLRLGEAPDVVQLADQAEHHGRHVAALFDTLRGIAIEPCDRGRSVAIAALVERIAALCRKGADGRGIHVTAEPAAADAARLVGPEADFATVLAMVTLHAIDTAPDGSRVELAALPEGAEVRASGDADADRGLAALAADPARGFAATGIDGFAGEPGAFGPAWLTLASCGIGLEVEHAAGLRRIRLVQRGPA